MASKTIYVYENWSSETPALLGCLYVDFFKNREHFAFEYNHDWLRSADRRFVLDPDLSLYNGRQYTPMDKNIFGMFADSCPDRWGRMLMKRREAIIAKKEERKPRNLNESDFLLGVYDEARMGALRFKLDETEKFLSNDKDLATPPWVTLRNLEFASYQLENDESGLEEKWLKQLLAPGSSLGGARPKATIQAMDGSLWIAKFPSKHDEYNSGAWEKVANDLAKMCGLNVPESKLENLSQNGSTFIVKRFDRIGDKRIHFSSAMTLLGKKDGEEGTSYLDLVDFVKAYGVNPKQDLKELWQRVVFNIMISNTDDHLRNHGFILENNGWRLSPVYDINPIPDGNSLALLIDNEDSSLDLELALATAELYNLKLSEAKNLIQDMAQVIRTNWKSIAEKYGLSRGSILHMEAAFER